MRVTDLADRVGMTKQALGEFANELERHGLMETVVTRRTSGCADRLRDLLREAVDVRD